MDVVAQTVVEGQGDAGAAFAAARGQLVERNDREGEPHQAQLALERRRIALRRAVVHEDAVVQETEAETRDSRMALERRLDRPISVFCYPNGDLNDGALASARRYYHSAVTVEPGTLHGKGDPHLLPRYAAHPQWTRRLARRMVLG